MRFRCGCPWDDAAVRTPFRSRPGGKAMPDPTPASAPDTGDAGSSALAAPPTSEERAAARGSGALASERMPPWLWKAVLLILGMVAVAYAGLVFVRQVRSLIIWLIAALF